MRVVSLSFFSLFCSSPVLQHTSFMTMTSSESSLMAAVAYLHWLAMRTAAAWGRLGRRSRCRGRLM